MGELPLTANVVDWARGPQPGHANVRQMIQGNGAQRSYTMDPNVDEVQVMIASDGMPMSARIEILQGPDTNKQVIELYSENGADRPFVANFAAPMSGNVFRLINTGPMEYPLTPRSCRSGRVAASRCYENRALCEGHGQK